MKTLFPVKNGTISQGYASTGDLDGKTYLQTFGTATHGALDIVSFHGDSLYACEDMDCYKTWTLNDQSLAEGLSHGFGARFISKPDSNGVCREYVYWHTMSNLKVVRNQPVNQGDVIGFEGDSGQVYQGGVAVPDSQKGLPPYLGTHLHWGYRLVQQTKDNTQAGKYLADIQDVIYKDINGFYYKILNADNGNNGMLDPMGLDLIYYDEWEKEQIEAKAVSVVSQAVEVIQNDTQTPIPQKLSWLDVLLNFLKGLLG